MPEISSVIDARERLYAELSRLHNEEGRSVVILEERTRVKSYGWVFFYQSRKYVETGKIADMLLGNGPVIVLRNGRIHQLGAAQSADDSIRAFERAQGLPPE